MAVLTVGIGETFATIDDAVAAAQSGDTIAVDAGTYTERDLTITQDLSLVAVGGTVDIVASDTMLYGGNVGKGLIVVGDTGSTPNVTIQGFDFSGARSAQSNGAGIRYQSGNLTLINDSFHNNQDGLLATPFVTNSGTVTVEASTFDHNGAGDGQSHNMYIGYVKQFTVQDSISEEAVVGHLVKSRAYNNTIVNNQLFDGPTYGSSYAIDLPDGGNAIIQGNTIEKGPNSWTRTMIHIGGGEDQHIGAVSITGNTFINDYGAAAINIVSNQEIVPVVISGNSLAGQPGMNWLAGVGSWTGNFDLDGSAVSDGVSTFFANPKYTTDFRGDSNAHTLTISKPSWTVEGGGGRLTLTMAGSGENVVGGSGGISVVNQGGGGFIFTAKGSTNKIALTHGAAVFSAGNDTITAPTQGGASHISIAGVTTVTGSPATASGTSYYISGQATVHEYGASDSFGISSGGKLTVSGATGAVNFREQDGTITYKGVNSGTISGGVATFGSYNKATMSITTYDKDGGTDRAKLTLTAGNYSLALDGGGDINARSDSGTISITNTFDPISFIGGSGSAHVWTGTGAAHITLGTGAIVTDASVGAPEGTFEIDSWGTGAMTISGFRSGIDHLLFGSGVTIASQSVTGGALHLSLSNHAQIVLPGLQHL